MLTPNTVLQNRYRIERRLGGGGMGTVYLASDSRLSGRVCAVKEMSPQNLGVQERNWAIETFRQEAQILANLSHPGLTNVTDFFPEGGNWYLVMEYIQGETLEAWLSRSPGGRFSLETALGIVAQLSEVLIYLHSQPSPVIFRDLKPSNVMLTPEGQVKLIDFGIARFFKPGQTRDTINLGTPGYAAPELYGGLGQSDPRSDVYSLGVLLYQMLTGYDPTSAVTPFPLPPIHTIIGGLPQHILAAVDRTIQVQPAQRFRSVSEFWQALTQPFSMPATARSTGVPGVALADGIAPTHSRSAGRSGGLAGVPAWLKWGTLGLLIVAVVLTGMALAFGSEGKSRAAIAEPTATQRSTATLAQPGTTPTGVTEMPPEASLAPTMTPALVTQTPASDPGIPDPPTLPPCLLAFDSMLDGDWEVYCLLDDNWGIIQLTDNTAGDGDVSWSPDGQRIAFDSDRDGNWNIYSMNTEGRDVQRLTNHPADEDSPSWSPDGLWIAFKTNRNGNWDLYTVNVFDLSEQQLTDDPAHDRMPAWSPDGTRLAFVSERSGNWDIWVMDVDGSNLRNLTGHSAQDSFPAWSPDGQRIAFHSYRDGNGEIYIMDAGGVGLQRMTTHAAADWGPAWSPDGSRLAFTSDRDGDGEIYVLDLNTGALTQLTFNNADDSWPDWAP